MMSIGAPTQRPLNRRLVTDSPATSITTTVVCDLFCRTSTKSWVTPLIGADFCSSVAPSRVILMLTYGILFHLQWRKFRTSQTFRELLQAPILPIC
jgi:hypothetical protein